MEIKTHVLGYPRVCSKRRHKWALESYWKGVDNGGIDAAELHQRMAAIRQDHWQMQAAAGVSLLTAGDFAYYDHVLELAEALGVVPERHQDEPDRLARCFAMGRGTATAASCEMKKWFNTNYHYFVPELKAKQHFAAHAPGEKPPDAAQQAREAKQLGLPVKTAVTGPVTFLYLSKLAGAGGFDDSKLALEGDLAHAYTNILGRLALAGTAWVQLDEPVLSLDMPASWQTALVNIYDHILAESDRPAVLLANAYGEIGAFVEQLGELDIEGLHVDMRNSRTDVEHADRAMAGRVLSVGAVDGRNVWRANLPGAERALAQLAGRDGGLWVGSSCSLMHVPMDCQAPGEDVMLAEGTLPVAFAKQKLGEIVALGRTLEGKASSEDKELFETAPTYPLHDLGWADDTLSAKPLQPSERKGEKGWPDLLLPTTTIGSLPQTGAIRGLRRKWEKATEDLRLAASEAEIQTCEQVIHACEEATRLEIKKCVEEQEQLGLDILVHGECERSDMVEYFAGPLDGIISSKRGWVQSYGSRSTRPPIIHDRVKRPEPISVEWSKYAASLTDKPMKAMLTGPITIICWSFPRANVPRMETAMQIAKALRAEVADLEAAGLPIVQIDEPALREGLPLAQAEQQAYLEQAVHCFNHIVAEAKSQIHTHMCYGEFGDVVNAITAMDADVISLETSRTDMSVLRELIDNGHRAGVGPGIYDVHSKRVPGIEEMCQLLEKAIEQVPRERLWVNPDCGLKTRGWEETRAALHNMVEAAKVLRAHLG